MPVITNTLLASLNALQTEHDSYATQLIKMRQMLGITDRTLYTEAVLQQVLDDYNRLKATPPATVPTSTVVPVQSGAGGTAVAGAFVGRSTPDSSIWKLAHEDDFPILAAEGEFLSKYSKWGAYPNNYTTTDKKGYYEPGHISVIDLGGGETAMNLRLVPGNKNPSGKPSGCAPYQRFSAQGDARSSTGLKGEHRIRCLDASANWHIANLLWPVSERWPADGEIDYHEQDLLGGIGAFLHYMNGTSGNDQLPFSTNIKLNTWHTVGFEWLAGKSFKFFVDGLQIGPTVTQRVPSNPMRNVLQVENSGLPAQESNVQYGWTTLWIAA